MRSIESTGRTVEEAIAFALEELNLSIADVLIEVLDHGQKGLFGIGTKQARVLVTEVVPEEAIMPKEMRPAPQPKEERPARAAAPRETREPRPAQEGTPQAREQRQPRSEYRGKTQGAPRREEEVVPPTESSAAAAKEFVDELLKHMNVRASAQVERGAEVVSVAIEGEDVAVLIGHRGETLDSIQYLTSLVVNKREDAHIRVRVDAAGYRARREESLVRLATRSAERAQKTGRRVPLEPMNPYERRILHTALQDFPGVTTHSEGEEPNRRVVIMPVSASGGGRR